MRNLIFVDTETTGLDPYDASLVELTWATLDSEPQTLWFGVKEVPDFIDNLIGFTKRGIAGRVSPYADVEAFLAASDGQTMVAANPGFDKGFIDAAGLWRFHYRMLDIESYAMAKLALDTVPSMKEIHDEVSQYIDITTPDHTSRNDVLAMRDAYAYLETL